MKLSNNIKSYNKNTTIRKYALLFVVVFLSLFLASCSSSPKVSDDTVKNTIIERDSNLKSLGVNDYKILITKNSLNKESKTMTLSAELSGSGANVEYSSKYEIIFLLHEKTWIADSFAMTDSSAIYSTGADSYYVFMDNIKGLSGIVNKEKNEYKYVLEPTFAFIGDFNEAGIATVQNNGLYGFIDQRGNYVLEPMFEFIGDFNEAGIAVAKKDGFYGYIDQNGNTVVGFMYDKAEPFIGQYAVVQIGKKYGVIDTSGKIVVKTMYNKIDFTSDFIIVSTHNNNGMVAWDEYGLYDYLGAVVLPVEFYGFTFINNLIYAETRDLISVDDNWCKLFDYTGKNMLGSGDLKNAIEIKIPHNGVSTVKCEFPTGDFISGYYSKPVSVTIRYYLCVDEKLNLITDKKFDSITEFNKLGYAVAHYVTFKPHHSWKDIFVSEKGNYAVLRNDGSEITVLPEIEHGVLGYAGTYYTDANEYYAYAYGITGLMNDKKYGIVDLTTKELTILSSVSMVDGTNCIIVSDKDTGLFGLYDGKDLALDYLFTEITYDDATGKISTKRGGETKVYTPIY